MERIPLSTSTKLNIDPADRHEESPVKKETSSADKTSARKARFSAIAADFEDFQCDLQKQQNRPKESYMRGRSARLSIGETRPSVLFTPAGNEALHKAQNRKSSSSIASPENKIHNNMTSINDTVSTVLGGSAGMMNLTISSISADFSMNGHIDMKSSGHNDDTIQEEKKHMRKKSEAKFSPAEFAPQSTSSPKDLEMSPAKSAALEKSTAKTIKFQFEEKLKGQEHVHIPMPKPIVNIAPKPVIRQERSKTEEKQEMRVGNLKNLKSRWEFSSSTGTPIHPDAPEEELIAAANRIRNSSYMNNTSHRSISFQKPVVETRKEVPQQHPEEEEEEEEEQFSENEVFEEEEENEVVEAPPREFSTPSDASRIIDQAFEFMHNGTPSPYRPSTTSPLAVQRCEESPLTRGVMNEVIEEEDVPMGSEGFEEEEEDDQSTACGDAREEGTTIEQEWEDRMNESRLPYSVSFYRKIQRERAADVSSTPIRPSMSSPIQDKTHTSPVFKNLVRDDEEVRNSVEIEKERIKRAIKVENEHISQSKRALALCRETPTFNGSREEIEMQRALLIAVEKQRALLAECQRLERDGLRVIDGPRGDVNITQLQLNISKDFVQKNMMAMKKSTDLYYFVAVLKWGEQVEVSKLATSDAALNRKGNLDFIMPLTLTKIPANFKAVVEIFGQKSMRESFTHEDKYKLKGSTLKTKSKTNPLFGGSSGTTSSFVPPAFCLSSTETNFTLLGSFTFGIDCPGKKMYQISHEMYPLEGGVLMKVRKRVSDEVTIEIDGFLSMYQRTPEGLGTWTRFWCVLSSGEMKFWKNPEDETYKECVVALDLATCIESEGAMTVSDICPYPNSFYIDVWAPKTTENGEVVKPEMWTANDIEPLRVMLAADTPSDLETWLSIINCCSRQLCTWRNPIT